MHDLVLLDGPMGSELNARGVATPLPGWSCHALETAPGVVAAIHADYARAGAEVHTTNTFRTRADAMGERWEELARLAVRLARGAVPAEHRVAGSIAPLADCYSPADSPLHSDPERARAEHRALARVLADEGCDLLLCETFPLVAEAWLATEEAVATGLETWVSFTPGPETSLLSPAEVAEGARGAVERGARAVLVNCLPRGAAAEYLGALRRAVEADPSVRIGVYANSGFVDHADGWRPVEVPGDDYGDHAATWRAAGASILGGCCGTGPRHVAACRRLREAP